jgi:hypothetical protein
MKAREPKPDILTAPTVGEFCRMFCITPELLALNRQLAHHVEHFSVEFFLHLLAQAHRALAAVMGKQELPLLLRAGIINQRAQVSRDRHKMRELALHSLARDRPLPRVATQIPFGALGVQEFAGAQCRQDGAAIVWADRIRRAVRSNPRRAQLIVIQDALTGLILPTIFEILMVAHGLILRP